MLVMCVLLIYGIVCFLRIAVACLILNLTFMFIWNKSHCLLPDPPCLDIAIAADSSGSIGRFRWNRRIRPFIRQFAVSTNFTVGETPSDIQVSWEADSVCDEWLLIAKNWCVGMQVTVASHAYCSFWRLPWCRSINRPRPPGTGVTRKQAIKRHWKRQSVSELNWLFAVVFFLSCRNLWVKYFCIVCNCDDC